jgi:hypothetical protein
MWNGALVLDLVIRASSECCKNSAIRETESRLNTTSLSPARRLALSRLYSRDIFAGANLIKREGTGLVTRIVR